MEILIKSILSHHDQILTKVYAVLDVRQFERTSRMMRRVFKNEHNLQLRILDLRQFSQGEFNDPAFSTLPQFYRQSFYRLLPHYFADLADERVLYLDCDMVCNGSLLPFYETDFNGKSIAVIGLDRSGNNGGPEKTFPVPYESIQIPIGDETYFNSGVVLFNLARFRNSNDLIDRYRTIAITYRANIKCSDQDILNLAFMNDKITLVDNRYNFCLADPQTLSPKMQSYVEREVRLMHFVDKRKPWRYWNYSNPIFPFYNRYYCLVDRGGLFRECIFRVFRHWPYYKIGYSFFGWVRHFFKDK